MKKVLICVLLKTLWIFAYSDGQTPTNTELLQSNSSTNSSQGECASTSVFMAYRDSPINFGVSKPNTTENSLETCEVTGKPLATMKCAKYDLSNATYFAEKFFPFHEKIDDYLGITNLTIPDADLVNLISYEDALTDSQIRNVFSLYHLVWDDPSLVFSSSNKKISSSDYLRLLSLALRISNTSLSRNMAYVMFTLGGQNTLYAKIARVYATRFFSGNKLTEKNISKIINEANLQEHAFYEQIIEMSIIKHISTADILTYLSLGKKLSSSNTDLIDFQTHLDSDVLEFLSLWKDYAFSGTLKYLSWAIIVSQENLTKVTNIIPASTSYRNIYRFVGLVTLFKDFNIQELIRLSQQLTVSFNNSLSYISSSMKNVSSSDLSFLNSSLINATDEELSNFLSTSTNISHYDLSKLVAFDFFHTGLFHVFRKPMQLVKYVIYSQPPSRFTNNLLYLLPQKYSQNLTSNDLTVNELFIFVKEISKSILDDEDYLKNTTNSTNLGKSDIAKLPKAAYDRDSLTSISCPDATTTETGKTFQSTIKPTVEEIRCNPQQLSKNNMTFSFGSTVVDSVASSNETCNDTNRPIAVARCLASKQQQSDGDIKKSSEKGKMVAEYDKSTLRVAPCDITFSKLNNDNINDSEISSTLEVMTSQPDKLSSSDVSLATNVLLKYQERVKDQSIEVEELFSITQSISNLAVAVDKKPEENTKSTETKSTLLSTLNNFVEIVSLPKNETTIDISSEEITVKVQRIQPIRDANNGNKTVYNDANFDLKTKGSSKVTLVNIPSDSISSIAQKSNNKEPVMFATLVDDGLSLDTSENTSQVVSIQAKNITLTNISFSIDFVDVKMVEPITKTNNPFKKRLHKAEIVEWDFINSKWKQSSNCHQLQNNLSESAYSCDAFASYAILFSNKIVPSNVALTVVSYFGCCLSIIFLLATVLIHVVYKKIRQTPTANTLVNICVCLLAVYIFYAAGVGRASNKQTCDAMTFLLHYATLACIMWMTVNAYQMYKAFTDFSYVMNSNLALLYILSYGLPFLLVLINFASTVLSLDAKQSSSDLFYESLYRFKFACWLKPPSLYWGFLLPVGIMLLFNFTVFGCLLRKVTCAKKKIKSSGKGKPLIDRFVNAVTMVTMMGLTWIFGYLLLIADDVVYQSAMQWIFTLLNTFQGVIIFYLYCIRRRNVRKVWLPRAVDEWSIGFLTKSTSAKSAASTSGSHHKGGVSTSGV